jgi:hypothetical protein
MRRKVNMGVDAFQFPGSRGPVFLGPVLSGIPAFAGMTRGGWRCGGDLGDWGLVLKRGEGGLGRRGRSKKKKKTLTLPSPASGRG